MTDSLSHAHLLLPLLPQNMVKCMKQCFWLKALRKMEKGSYIVVSYRFHRLNCTSGIPGT